jgi:Tfp pilus assembly protein PilF
VDSSFRSEAIILASELLEDTSRFAEAEELLANEVVGQQFPDVRILERLAESALRDRSQDRLKRWTDILTKTTGEYGSAWRYYRAASLLMESPEPDSGAFAQSVRLHAELRGIRPSWPKTHLLAARIAEMQGRLEKAASSYQRAIELGEESVSVAARLVAVLYQQNRWGDLESLLHVFDAKAITPQLHLLAESALARAGGAWQESSAREGPGGDRRHEIWTILWDAATAESTGHPDHAELSYRRAVAKDPSDTRCWGGLIAFLVRQGKDEAARQVIAALDKKLTVPPGQKAFLMAQAHELLNDHERSMDLFARASDQLPRDVAVQRRSALALMKRRPEKAQLCMRRTLHAANPSSRPCRRTRAERISPVAAGVRQAGRLE